ncbi:MAG: hypothetical protein ACYT04_79690, partial [Nostoc sp.]
IISILESLFGITCVHQRDFKSSSPIIRLKDNSTVRTRENPVGVVHVFLDAFNTKHLRVAFLIRQLARSLGEI